MAIVARGPGFVFVVAGAIALGACSSSTKPAATADAGDPIPMCTVHRPVRTPTCGAALCGNGTKDSCPMFERPPGEECDGLDLGGVTCKSLGYAGGVARCDGSCFLDLSGCDECGSDPHVEACAGPSPLNDGEPLVFAMATQASEIGVAWITNTDTGSRVRFARLSSSLAVISVGCVGSETSRSIALAAAGSGWIIAVENVLQGLVRVPGGLVLESSIDVIALDGSGAPVSARTIPTARTPVLIARPGGGLLLLFNDSPTQGNTFSTDTVLRGQLVNPDGSPGAGPEMILPTVTPELAPGGVFVGNGFLIAQSSTTISPPYGGIQLAKVGLDLSTQPGASITGSQAFGPRFAWTGSVALMTYNSFHDTAMGSAPDSFWQRVDGNGALVGASVQITGAESPFGVAPIAESGGRSWIVEPVNPGSPLGVRVKILDGFGAPVADDIRVDQNAAFDLGNSAIAFLGTKPVVSWLSNRTGISLAVVAPSP